MKKLWKWIEWEILYDIRSWIAILIIIGIIIGFVLRLIIYK